MLKRIKETFKNEKGLTLVELLAVIVILAIVGAIAFVMIGNIIENSKKDAHVANALQLIESAKLYEANGNSIEGSGVSATKLQKEGLLGELIDPWTKVEYDSLAAADATTGQATVQKSADSVYSVRLDGDKCEIKSGTGEKANTEANLIKEGRNACQ